MLLLLLTGLSCSHTSHVLPGPEALLTAAAAGRAGAPLTALCVHGSPTTANGLWRHFDLQVSGQRCEAEESDFFTAGGTAGEVRYTQASTSMCCNGAFAFQHVQSSSLVQGRSGSTALLIVPALRGVRVRGQLSDLALDDTYPLSEPYGLCSAELRDLGLGQTLRRSRFDPAKRAVVVSEIRLLERTAGQLRLEIQEGRQTVRLTLGEADLLPRAFAGMGLEFEPCDAALALAARQAALK